MSGRPGLLGRMVRGAVAGAVATWFMDLATTGYLQTQSPEDAAREKAAQPNGRSSVENMLEFGTGLVGLRIEGDARASALNLTHYALGVVPGALYGALRPVIPALGAGRGLLFGMALFIFNDEVLNSALGFAGPPDAYPASSHARGLVGHAVLGVTTDATLDILGG